MQTSNYFPPFEVNLNSAYYTNASPTVTPRAYSQYISATSASLPVSFYNVRDGLLEFVYRVTGQSETTTSLDIGQGQFSATDLVSLVSLSGFFSGLNSPFTAFVRYNENRNRFRFYFANVIGLDYFYLKPGTLASQMGFVTATGGVFPTTLDIEFPKTNSVESDAVVDLRGTRNIYLLTNFQVRQLDGGTPVLTRIPVNEPFGSTLFYEDDFAQQMYWSPIGDIEVRFLDDDGIDIDFNGAPWNLTLRFDFKPPDLHPPYFDDSFIPVV